MSKLYLYADDIALTLTRPMGSGIEARDVISVSG